MKEDYITCEQAILLSELGFPDESLPTQALVQKWFRNEKKLNIEVRYNHNPMPHFYKGMVFNYNRIADNNFVQSTHCYSNYEEALSEGIDMCINILKNKRNMNEKEFYYFYKDKMWNICCHKCNKIVECTPHYRDKEDENDYGICPICGEKLYVAE